MKGILIVDSGTTKADWSFLPQEANGSIVRCQTQGINPLHGTEDNICLTISQAYENLRDYEINAIKFFGAGCLAEKEKNCITKFLYKSFGTSDIYVDSDIAGAAKALFGESPGLACILGTGSNTALYEAGKISKKIPSLGYILGDEGSGVALGKALLTGIFKKNFNPEIIELFNAEFKLTQEELIMRVYQKPEAAAFIASFSPFIYKNRHLESIKNLIERELDKFFTYNVAPYNLPEGFNIGFVGSVAVLYQDIIEGLCLKYRLSPGAFLKSPITGLEACYSKIF